MVKKFTNIDEICAMVEKSMAETRLPDDLPSTASRPLLEAQLRSGKLVSAIMRYWMEEYNNLGDPMVAAQAITVGVANGIFPFAMEFADIFQGGYEQEGHNAIHAVTALISLSLHNNLAAVMGEELSHNARKQEGGPTFADIHLKDVQ